MTGLLKVVMERGMARYVVDNDSDLASAWVSGPYQREPDHVNNSKQHRRLRAVKSSRDICIGILKKGLPSCKAVGDSPSRAETDIPLLARGGA